eukprot:86327_1
MRVVRVETDLKKIPPSLWVQDSKSSICSVCNDHIIGGWIFSNKHHCRYCGHIVCALCSNHAIFDTQNKSNYHRICDICYKNTIKKLKSSKNNTTTTPKKPLTEPLKSEPNIRKSPPASPLLSMIESKPKLEIDYQIHNSSDKYTDPNAHKYQVNRRDTLVSGFIRLHKANINLPIDMINLIIKWAFINDILKQYSNQSHLLISNSAQSIERISDNNQHCYYSFGNSIVYNNTIKQWIIRIDKINYYTNNYCSMLIGIAQYNKINWIKSLLGDFTYGVYKGYGLRVAMKSKFIHAHQKEDIYIQNGCLRKGDIIKIKLDLSKKNKGKLYFNFEDSCGKAIKYGLDDNLKWLGMEKCLAFDNIDKHKKYVLVIGMYCQNKVTFLEECI